MEEDEAGEVGSNVLGAGAREGAGEEASEIARLAF